MALVPLQFRGRTIGVMTVLRSAPEVHTPADVKLLSAFATHAAIAIENADLYGQVASHAQRLEALVTERTHDLAPVRSALSGAGGDLAGRHLPDRRRRPLMLANQAFHQLAARPPGVADRPDRDPTERPGRPERPRAHPAAHRGSGVGLRCQPSADRDQRARRERRDPGDVGLEPGQRSGGPGRGTDRDYLRYQPAQGARSCGAGRAGPPGHDPGQRRRHDRRSQLRRHDRVRQSGLGTPHRLQRRGGARRNLQPDPKRTAWQRGL